MSQPKLFAICLSLFCFQSAIAQSLAEKKLYAQEEKAIESQLTHINKQCQSAITVRFDWANFTKAGLEERGAAGFCNEALAAVARVCDGSADARQGIQEGVKSVVCSRATPRSIVLKDHELHFGMDYDAANDADAVYEYLMNNL